MELMKVIVAAFYAELYPIPDFLRFAWFSYLLRFQPNLGAHNLKIYLDSKGNVKKKNVFQRFNPIIDVYASCGSFQNSTFLQSCFKKTREKISLR